MLDGASYDKKHDDIKLHLIIGQNCFLPFIEQANEQQREDQPEEGQGV